MPSYLRGWTHRWRQALHTMLKDQPASQYAYQNRLTTARRQAASKLECASVVYRRAMALHIVASWSIANPGALQTQAQHKQSCMPWVGACTVRA